MIRILVLSALLMLAPWAQAADKGITKFKSPHSVEKTMDRLEAILRVRNITVFNRINHAGGAAQVGKEKVGGPIEIPAVDRQLAFQR